MKLPIKDKYFRLIKEGKKNYELRDAHLTLVNEKTKEKLRVEVKASEVIPNNKWFDKKYPGLFRDKYIIIFEFTKKETRDKNNK